MSSQMEHLQPALPDAPAGLSPSWLPVRKLHAGHRPKVLAHLKGLVAEDRQRRFGHAASDEQVADHVSRLDFERDDLLGVFNRQLELVALAHLAVVSPQEAPASGDAAPEPVAELALSVGAHLRGRGLGRLLLEHAMRRAQLRGVTRLVLHLARDNLAMRAIVGRLGAEMEEAGADLQAAVPLAGPTLGSALQSWLDAGAAELDYRVKLRVMRLRRALPGVSH